MKLAQLQDAIRIGRVQKRLPVDRDLAEVRANLEDRIGATVSQRLAAKALGVSHTAVQRWIASRDIPVVINERGRAAVPTRFVIELALRIDRERAGKRHTHSLEPVMLTNRQRADALLRANFQIRRSGGDAHAQAADFALAYHRAVADQLTREQIDAALRTVWRLRDRGLMHERYADEWERLLNADKGEIKAAIAADSEKGRDLRQNSPFAATLSEPERAAVFDMVRR